MLSDGNPVPVNHNGMAAFAHQTDSGVVRLIRNQEESRGTRHGLGAGAPGDALRRLAMLQRAAAAAAEPSSCYRRADV